MKTKGNRQPGRPPSHELEKPTNETILNEATRLFLDNSYQNVSVDDIAKSCNVTKATIYYYYETKAELFTESIVEMMNRIREKMHVILHANKPLRERLLQVTTDFLTATVDMDIDGILREAKDHLSLEQINTIQKTEENMHKEIEETLAVAMEKGEIRETNPIFAARAYLSLLKMSNNRDIDGIPIFTSAEETAEQIIDFLWYGLKQ